MWYIKGNIQAVGHCTYHGSTLIKADIKYIWEITLCVQTHTHSWGRPPSNILFIIGISAEETGQVQQSLTFDFTHQILLQRLCVFNCLICYNCQLTCSYKDNMKRSCMPSSPNGSILHNDISQSGNWHTIIIILIFRKYGKTLRRLSFHSIGDWALNVYVSWNRTLFHLL